ncbi:MAG: hypothetical protein VXY31_01120, partial [Candidatus Thermoplasmatota archaeon]|nr:hypothetical protein [Candidatus Thermoplasmatota archaeon]
PWSYLEPTGGYPSTLSSDGPIVAGQPSGDLPVFASPSHSGWTSENVDLMSISEINNADRIQFKFRLWTHPSSQNLRPGWYLDNISLVNNGISTGGGTPAACAGNQATPAPYTSDFLEPNDSGATATSSFYLPIYCTGLSIHDSADEDWFEVQVIAGATYYANVSFIDSYGDIDVRWETASGSWLASSGSTSDNENMTFTAQTSGTTYVQVYGWAGNTNAYDIEIETTGLIGVVSENIGFENSYATSPEITHAPGWSTAGTSDTWNYGFLGSSLTLEEPASFPYLYGTDLTGPYSDNKNGYLLSPNYSIPDSGASPHFSKWSCMDPFYSTDGAQLQYRVNGGSWQHFQPSIAGWYDGVRTSTWNNPWGSDEIWFDGECDINEMSEREASLDQWSGEQMQFRFQFSTDTCCQNSGSEDYEGFYVDDFGILIPNYSSNGSWTSPSLDISNQSGFNMGYVDVDAEIPEGTRVLVTILDSATLSPLEGFDMGDLPLSLAGIDAATHPSVRIQVHLETVNSSLTPKINSVRLDGFRTLSSSSGESNGWSFSPSTVIDGDYIVSTGIAGTIDSEYLTSSRPIRALSVTGDYSGVTITFKDANGAVIGTPGITGGLVVFPWLQPGYRATISLSPAGSINQLNISAKFAEPARSPTVDLGSDGTNDWAFPMGSSYGNLGWQSLIEGGTMQRSESMYLTSSNPATVSVLVPSGTSLDPNVDATSWAAAGFMAISPVGSPTLDSPVVVSLGSAS